jgi:hypothetical protein
VQWLRAEGWHCGRCPVCCNLNKTPILRRPTITAHQQSPPTHTHTHTQTTHTHHTHTHTHTHIGTTHTHARRDRRRTKSRNTNTHKDKEHTCTAFALHDVRQLVFMKVWRQAVCMCAHTYAHVRLCVRACLHTGGSAKKRRW